MISVIQKPTPNYTKHVVPRDVKACVLHVAEGSIAAVDDWFGKRASEVSAHFMVGFDGSLRQYVSIHDVGYHSGRVERPTWKGLRAGNPNSYTVGIEHEGRGLTAWPEPMLLTSTILAAWLCVRFGWQPSPLTFPMHREIFADKTCPGPAFDRPVYLARVAALLAAFTDGEIREMIRGMR